MEVVIGHRNPGIRMLSGSISLCSVQESIGMGIRILTCMGC